MTLGEDIAVLGSLYLLYKDHVKELQNSGYSRKEAFWLNFACLPFLPWNEQSEYEISLNQILKLYLGIYQFDIDKSFKAEDVPAFIELLIDRYHMAQDIASIEDTSRLEIELGYFALPGENEITKLAHAGSIVLNTLVEWRSQRGKDPYPAG